MTLSAVGGIRPGIYAGLGGVTTNVSCFRSVLSPVYGPETDEREGICETALVNPC